MDLENEQTLHGPGSVAGLGMEPTIQAGVSATLNQPQGTKAFLMVGNNETDRGMLRFMWLKDPGTLQPST